MFVLVVSSSGSIPASLNSFRHPIAVSPRPLPEKARELIAMEALRQDAERTERDAYDDPGPDEWWQWIPALFGMPVEEEAPALRFWPWLTYGLAVLLVVVFVLTAGIWRP